MQQNAVIEKYGNVIFAISAKLTFDERYQSVDSFRSAIKNDTSDIDAEDVRAAYPKQDHIFIRNQMLQILTEDEVVKAARYLNGLDVDAESAHPGNSLAQDELLILNDAKLINSNSKLALVGSGAMPSTAIDIISRGYRDITLIDRNPDSVDLGRRVLEKKFNMRMADEQVHACDAEEMNYKDFDIIWIANFIDNKNLTMKKIADDRKNAETIVLVRDAEGVRSLLNNNLAEENFREMGEKITKTAISPSRINTTAVYKLY